MIKTKILDGSLQQALRESIHDAIHITPVIGDVDESYQKIKAVNISACAANMEPAAWGAGRAPPIQHLGVPWRITFGERAQTEWR